MAAQLTVPATAERKHEPIPATRYLALDAMRGFVMLLLVS